MHINFQLGKRVRYLRQNRGWSQEELAFNSNINSNYLSDLERGRRNPSLMILKRLADAFEIDMSTLLKGVDNV
jgi:transcriptional regulator with XRE-family HTH domain